MKKSVNLLLLTFALFLAGCSGSDVYQGNWKATDADGNKLDISFEPKSFTIKDMNGKTVTHEYTQNSVKTYGIRLSDGRTFNIFFPISDDAGKGMITLESGEPLYIISRASYITYKDLYKLTE